MKFSSILPVLVSTAAAIPTFGFYNGQFNQGPSTICVLDNGVRVIFQNDGNLVVYNSANQPLRDSRHVAPNNNCNGGCTIAYQSDGNLVTYYNGNVIFNSGTGGGQGALLVCSQVAPYLFVLNQQGNKIWTI